MQPHNPNPYGPYPPPQQSYAAAPPVANPYPAPPGMYRQNVAPYGATSGPLVGPTLRKVKLALGITHLATLMIGMTLFILGAILGEEGSPLMLTGSVVLIFFNFALIGYMIANMMWLHQFWSWIPPEQRHTSMWRKYISPGTAVGFMFIPYFNIYWMFVIYLGIADIMERLRVQYPCSKGPAKNIALIALIVPMVFFPAAPFVQYFFAKHVEEMAREMHARMHGAAPAC
jgi:hypothetical protein